MNPILRQFYENSNEREAVHEFLIDTLKQMAVEHVFDKKAVAGIYEGKRAIDKTFERLEEEYGIIKSKEPESSR